MIKRPDLPGGFPSDLVPASQKNKEWISQYIKAAYEEFERNWPNGFYNARDRYHNIKLYMNGNQSITKYKTLMDPLTTANGDDSWLRIDWSVIPFVPKLRRMALSILNKKDFTIQAHAVDPLALDDQDKYYRDKASKIILQEEFKKNGLPDELLQTLNIRKEDPKDFDELDIHMEYGYKHQAAVEIEMALNLVMNTWNNYKSIREQIREHLFDYGFCGIEEVQTDSGKIDIEVVDPFSAITSYSKDTGFRDLRYAGKISEMTIADLKLDAGDEISASDYEDIVTSYQGKLNNPAGRRGMSNVEGKNFDKWKTEVVNLEFKTIDYITLEKRINKKGNRVVARAKDSDFFKKDSATRRYTKIPHEAVYTGKWVLGTNIFYKCKKVTNTKRRKGKEIAKTGLSYHFRAPFMYDMQTYSIGEQLIPVIDQLHIAHYKLQNVILRAKPRGIKITIDGLEEVPVGKGGKNLKPHQLIDFYNQTGNIVVRMMNKDGELIPFDPVSPLENGLGDEANQWWNVIRNHMQMARDILGFNEITDGSTPDARTLNGVAELAAQSTNNSLQFITDAEKSITEEVASSVALRIKSVINSGADISGYIKALGKNSMKFFKVERDVTAYDYGILIEDLPDAEQMARFRDYLITAQKTQEIGTDDALGLESLSKSNIKLAQAMLRYRIRERQEKASEEAERREKSNAQLQQQAAMVAEEEKRKTLEFEHKTKMQQINLKGEWDYKITELEVQGRAQNEITRTDKEITKRLYENESQEFIAEQKALERTAKSTDASTDYGKKPE